MDNEQLYETLLQNGYTQNDIDGIIARYLGGESIDDIVSEMSNLGIDKKIVQNTVPDAELIKTHHLWESADEHIMPMISSILSMHVYLEISGKKIKCLLDTGAQGNVITQKLVEELNLESFVDKGYKMDLIGVGESKCKLYGIIPYIEVKISDCLCPIYFNVIEKNDFSDVILGLSFMMFYEVQLDFKNRCMHLMGKKIEIQIDEKVSL